MRVDDDGSEQRTLWCGNISDRVTDELLYELFLQAGPVERLHRPRDHEGRPKAFAFIVYKHECSAPYAVELFKGERLFNRVLNLSSRSKKPHIPVLDTDSNDFMDCPEDEPRHRKEGHHRNERKRKEYERNDDERSSGADRKRFSKEKDEPTSWAELNALKGKGLFLNGQTMSHRADLQGAPMHGRESNSQDVPTSITDFERLLQMGSQMMIPNMMHPGMLGFGVPPFSPGGPMVPMSPMNLMGPVGPMYPSMQGGMGGGYPSMQGGIGGCKRFSPERESRRSDHQASRGSRRDHPYEDKRRGSQFDNRRHSDNYNHRRHDRGYSSSRSSHERERRDRRSR